MKHEMTRETTPVLCECAKSLKRNRGTEQIFFRFLFIYSPRDCESKVHWGTQVTKTWEKIYAHGKSRNADATFRKSSCLYAKTHLSLKYKCDTQRFSVSNCGLPFKSSVFSHWMFVLLSCSAFGSVDQLKLWFSGTSECQLRTWAWNWKNWVDIAHVKGTVKHLIISAQLHVDSSENSNWNATYLNDLEVWQPLLESRFSPSVCASPNFNDTTPYLQWESCSLNYLASRHFIKTCDLMLTHTFTVRRLSQWVLTED